MSEENVCPRTGKPCDKSKTITYMGITSTGPFLQHHHVNVCPDCAPGGAVVGNVLDSVFSGLGMAPPQSATSAGPLPSLRCEACGWTVEDFKRTGKAGCEHCYRTVQDFMTPILAKFQDDATQHVGKAPKGGCCGGTPSGCCTAKPSREALEAKLAGAVKEERYEDAALIRDALKKIAGASAQEEIAGYKKEMDIAVKEERYEDAAIFRDKIRRLGGK